MSHIKIKWDGDEGKVTINPSFHQLYDIARLDCLQDAIWELQQIYNRELALFHTPMTIPN